jgi:thiopurine S-methyltransferase
LDRTQGIIDFWYENSDKFPSFRAEKIAGTSAYRYTSGADDRLQILQADVFSPLLTRELIATPAGVDVVWDRASLVALNPHQRGTYAEMIERLSAPSAQMLLNVFVYNQDEMNGPPFSVPPQAVDELYSDAKGYTRQLLST